MSYRVKSIEVEPGAELERLLDEANKQPILFELNGLRYRLERDPEDIFAYYDPEAVREALKNVAGILRVKKVKHSKPGFALIEVTVAPIAHLRNEVSL